MTNWATESAARIEERLLVEESVGLLNDLARERLLAHYHDRAGGGATWLADVVVPLERAIHRFPSALVPRFNLVRVLVHFGDAAQVRQGVGLLDDTLRWSDGQWQIDLLDDVLPWDFCPSLFNYRRYFDAVTQSLGTSSPRIETLIAVILASLNHYRSKYAAEIVGERTDIEYAAEAVRLDPGFAEYVVQDLQTAGHSRRAWGPPGGRCASATAGIMLGATTRGARHRQESAARARGRLAWRTRGSCKAAVDRDTPS